MISAVKTFVFDSETKNFQSATSAPRSTIKKNRIQDGYHSRKAKYLP